MSGDRIQEFAGELRKSCYAPKTWGFWRTTIFCFAFCSMLGHWLEMPYCAFMGMFGIVDSDYATLVDPWYYPYWVYGFGALGMTLALEPFKEHIIARCKTLLGAFAIVYILTVVLAGTMETVFGLLINQPDPFTGEYPFWDNSELPLNILQQGWLVNDLVIGLVAMVYLWLIFPIVDMVLSGLGERRANIVFAVAMAVFAVCVALTVVSLL